MKIYRVFDKKLQKIIKIGKRTNDLYISKPALIHTLKTYYGEDCIPDRFRILTYDAILNKKESDE